MRLRSVLLTMLVGSAMLIPATAVARPTIVGGAPAPKAPWNVLLEHRDGSVCSGSIIAAHWVLTAAHCVHGESPSQYTVWVGSLERRRGVRRAVQRHHVYPAYQDRSDTQQLNDIALLRLYTPVRTTYAPLGGPLRPGHTVTTYGWGQTDGAKARRKGRDAPRLKAVIERVDHVGDRRINVSPVYGHSHWGDSGGPVFRHGRQVAMVSTEQAGDYRKGTYVRISTYLQWIKRTAGV